MTRTRATATLESAGRPSSWFVLSTNSSAIAPLLIACHGKQTHAVIKGQQGPQAQSTDHIPVTPDNFVRAESICISAEFVKNGGFGKFDHTRDPPSGMPDDVVQAIKAGGLDAQKQLDQDVLKLTTSIGLFGSREQMAGKYK